MAFLIEYNSNVAIDKSYLLTLKSRSQKSKVYKKYQLTGLLLTEILNDSRRKSLYIRLAKEFDETILLDIAKRVAASKNIRNRGAYFMKLLADPSVKQFRKPLPKKPETKKLIQRSLFKNGKKWKK